MFQLWRIVSRYGNYCNNAVSEESNQTTIDRSVLLT